MKALRGGAATDELLLQIDDNGSGLSQTTRMSGIGEYTATHGGTFQITSTPEQGTRLQWRVPLPGSGTGHATS
jgi:signal transduction histidine kinase